MATRFGGLDARNFWDKVRRNARHVPFLDEAVAMWFCLRDPATPTRVKMIAGGALAYFVLPIDVVPDFIAVLGYTDDATVLFTALRAVRPYVTEAHRAKARETLANL